MAIASHNRGVQIKLHLSTQEGHASANSIFVDVAETLGSRVQRGISTTDNQSGEI